MCEQSGGPPFVASHQWKVNIKQNLFLLNITRLNNHNYCAIIEFVSLVIKVCVTK